MKNIKIEGFKAFNEPLELNIEEKNVLLYGENGAGKSSMFDAFKIIFLRDVLERRKIKPTSTPEEEVNIKNDLYSSFNNKKSSVPFKLTINNNDYEVFDKSGYKVFLISPDILSICSSISLKEMMMDFWFDPSDDIGEMMNDYHSIIAEDVTRAMNDIFHENITIEFDPTDEFKCIVSDTEKNLRRKDELNYSFNESKLHLIKLLIVFGIVDMNSYSEVNIKKILVLDDFVTSLDAANRTFLMRYILTKYKNFQKIILTHNVSFYNLARYIICNIDKKSEEWIWMNLYMINNIPHISQQNSEVKAGEIKDKYNAPDAEVEQVGNMIRKRFEVLLHELSKLLQVGTFEESKKIIELLSCDKPIYLNDSGKNVYDLIEGIEKILKNANDHNLKQRLVRTIEDYRYVDLHNLKKIIKDLTLYQKVTMHPMSHGTNGLIAFTDKEIKESLRLLELLEKCINSISSVNVTNI